MTDQIEEEIEIKVTDVSEKTCYTLPLAPQDLVAIYKDKGDDADNEYVLWVDYAKSRLKLSASHIMIYLANTNFKATFSAIDDELIVEYIKCNFLVDSPLLGRILSNIIKVKFNHELAPVEQMLFDLFDIEKIYAFINDHGDLLEEVIENMRSSIPFALTKLYENLPDETKEKEVQLADLLKDVTVTDTPTQCGPNVSMMPITCWDSFLVILTYTGLSMEYNQSLYNGQPKYFGKDLFFILNNSNVVSNILTFLPPGFLESEELNPEE